MLFQGIFFLQAINVFAIEDNASPIETVQPSVPGAAVVGRGILSYAFWDVYEATLFAPAGVWDSNKPFALSIEYFRAIKGKDIADRSVQEIRQQGFTNEVTLAAWNSQMKTIFPDVKKGTVLTAVYIPNKQTTFYKGADIIGVIKGDDFGKSFFGIWLAEKTSEPQLRRALLDLK
ncbi:MAG: hypothetical protein B0W54_06790 [Cellvibrio sp. 79]|nr:MAG: hypothetical protein B0W54_06790 [Cellvibrio sp. 79]